MRASTELRHDSHSRNVRPRNGLTRGSSGGHVALLRFSSFQWSWIAVALRAGNHWAAWESPNAITRVVAEVSP